MNKHPFKLGKVRPTCCEKDEDGVYCNKKARHLIHKMIKPKNYQAGEIVGQYVVQDNGSFRKIKD